MLEVEAVKCEGIKVEYVNTTFHVCVFCTSVHEHQSYLWGLLGLQNMNKWITWPTETEWAFCDNGYIHKIFHIKS